MNWTKESPNIEKMIPHVNKLITNLEKLGITFQQKDGHLDNVVFTKDEKVVKIAHQCFYRFSGMCMIKKETPGKTKATKNLQVWVEVTNDMFINSYMFSIILNCFKIDKNGKNIE